MDERTAKSLAQKLTDAENKITFVTEYHGARGSLTGGLAESITPPKVDYTNTLHSFEKRRVEVADILEQVKGVDYGKTR